MEKIKLRYQCSAYGHLEVNNKLFCNICQRQLIDFREKPLNDVITYTKTQDGCGIFLANQIIADSFVLITFSKPKAYILALLTLFFTETSYGQMDNISPIEHVQTSSLDKEKKSKSKNLRKLRQNKNIVLLESKVFEYGIFVNRKFPFVTFKRRIYKHNFSGFW